VREGNEGHIIAMQFLLLIYSFCCILPRDAELARYMLYALCPSVSVYVTSRSSVETAERIKPAFGMVAYFDLCYTVL